MGNCLFGGMADPHAAIKVVTSNGGIMEFCAPVTVSFITSEFQGHGIFRSHDLFWKPLSQFDELVAGETYYLLPLNNHPAATVGGGGGGGEHVVRQGHIRSHSVPITTSYPAQYKMSLDFQHNQGVGLLKRSSSMEPFSSRTSANNSSSSSNPASSSRFWKVKLVISPEQLLDILAQEARTKELIESVRIVAKCGIAAGGISSAAAAIVSDQWNLFSSSWSSSSRVDALVVDI